MRNSIKSIVLLIVTLASMLAPLPARAKVAPALAGTLSIIPGLGQVANGDVLPGVAWFVTTVGLFMTKNSISHQAGFDLWLYNTYDAYQGAGGGRGAPRLNVFQSYIASFNPLNVVDWVAPPALAYATLGGGKAPDPVKNTPQGIAGRIAFYSFVGFGEEGLFRGFLYPELSALFSSKVIGGLVSSVAFAYSHAVNGSADLAPRMLLQRSVMGGVMCLQTSLQKGDIRHSIFTHTWWDFLVTRGGQIDGAMVKHEFRL